MSGTRTGRLVASAFVVLTWAAFAGPSVVEAQTRGAERRAAPRGQLEPQGEPSEVLLRRFAQRVAQALGLDEGQARRLREELQASRRARARIAERARSLRRELAGLVRREPADETRIGRLLDELIRLEVQAARVAVDEQRRLSEFLTPLQRARVVWLRQRLARQALERRDRATDAPPRDLP